MFSNFSSVDMNDLCNKHLNIERKACLLGRREDEVEESAVLWAGDLDAACGLCWRALEGRGER